VHDADVTAQCKGNGEDIKKEKKLPKGYVYEEMEPKVGTGKSGKDGQCEGKRTTELEEYESEPTGIDE